ncbi:hypothetical protein B9Z45_12330 [Limnohabitans sp. 2KL-17]|nr:hypothetical protein B9Z45_12330 [Limnohabitans sp. 2KL-17]
MLLLPAAAAVLVACGGGGGGSSSQITNSISGVAAIGAPISGALITLRDVNGKTVSVSADTSGEYSFADLSGFVAPFQITASGQIGDRQVVHHAIVPKISGAQTANVSQLTTAATALLVTSSSIGDLSPSQLSALTDSSIQNAYDSIKIVLKPLTDKLIGNNFDPLTTQFKANGEGADLLLDHVAMNTRAGYVELSNKMASSTETDTVSTVVISKSAGVSPSGAMDAATIEPPKFKLLLDKFTACFAVSETARLTNKTVSSATLDPACADLAVPGYLQNGAPFMLRWARALNSNTINTTAGAKFNSVDIRLLSNANPLRLAVNINWQDNAGSGYTTPEVIEKQSDDTWKLYGNRRKVSASVDATLNYLRDMTVAPNNYNNVNFSRIESGMRFQFDPRITFDATTGEPDLSATIDYRTSTGYKNTGASFSAINTNKGLKTITQCVVVMGPGRFEGSKWMGMFPHGVMLKRPSGSTVQDYLAIDRRLTSAQKTALNQTALNSTVSISNFCGNTTGQVDSVTDTSSSTYLVESEPLLNQVHPLTGVVSTAMNGRDSRWNTGARYARMKPDAELAKTFDNNPVFTYYVIDSDNKLRMKFNVRYLGELPPASVAKDLVDAEMLSVPTKQTLTKYLDFSATGAATLNNQSSVDATWTTKSGAIGADLVGFYSEVSRGRPGPGLRGPLSIHTANQSFTGLNADGIWSADDDLAAELDAIPGINFWNAAGGFAKEKHPTTACSPSSTTSTVDTSSFGVGRSMQELSSRTLATGSVFYGVDGLTDACLGTSFSTPVTNAYVYREVWTRTYTEKNVRVYHITANKAFR